MTNTLIFFAVMLYIRENGWPAKVCGKKMATNGSRSRWSLNGI